jgi:hypothetical protein
MRFVVLLTLWHRSTIILLGHGLHKHQHLPGMPLHCGVQNGVHLGYICWVLPKPLGVVGHGLVSSSHKWGTQVVSALLVG